MIKAGGSIGRRNLPPKGGTTNKHFLECYSNCKRGRKHSGGDIEVLQMVAAGKSNKEIGARLFISEGTVKTHKLARKIVGADLCVCPGPGNPQYRGRHTGLPLR